MLITYRKPSMIRRFWAASAVLAFFGLGLALYRETDWGFLVGVVFASLAYQVAHRLEYGTWFDP